jgi:hypothetical protein
MRERAFGLAGMIIALLYLSSISTGNHRGPTVTRPFTYAPRLSVNRALASTLAANSAAGAAGATAWANAAAGAEKGAGCLVHTDIIDPTIPFKTHSATDGDGYLILAIVNRSYRVDGAPPSPGAQDRAAPHGDLPCLEKEHVRLFSAPTGDDHKNAARATVTGCRSKQSLNRTTPMDEEEARFIRASRVYTDSSDPRTSHVRSPPYNGAVCTPLLFGSSYAVVHAFVSHHLVAGFERVFIYSRSIEETFAVDGVTWFIVPKLYTLGYEVDATRYKPWSKPEFDGNVFYYGQEWAMAHCMHVNRQLGK